LTSLCFGAIIYTYTQTETVMEFAIEARNAKVQEFLASLMPSVIEQLGLTKSKRAVLVKVTNDNLEGMEGATLYIEFADCYLVLIKPAKRLTKTSLINMATTLAHEMVHVRQLAKGMLKYLPNESKIWMGKRYTKKTKYLDQPWELDAFARQEIILRKAIET
jgi:tRNA uridine 5-carbamoylmethylation protein Kti12